MRKSTMHPDSEYLETIRKRLDLTQVEFGRALGITARAYQDITKNGMVPKASYRLAADWLSLKAAMGANDPGLASDGARPVALALSLAGLTAQTHHAVMAAVQSQKGDSSC
jgi:hypothetical protein